MTHQQKKIEAALEAYFRADGWSLDISPDSGDHCAIVSVSSGPYPPAEVEINLTECAKTLAEELGQ